MKNFKQMSLCRFVKKFGYVDFQKSSTSKSGWIAFSEEGEPICVSKKVADIIKAGSPLDFNKLVVSACTDVDTNAPIWRTDKATGKPIEGEHLLQIRFAGEAAIRVTSASFTSAEEE